ncbi:hypothetical protein AAMO2058_000466200 [Amorphochlora amoebiformis]
MAIPGITPRILKRSTEMILRVYSLVIPLESRHSRRNQENRRLPYIQTDTMELAQIPQRRRTNVLKSGAVALVLATTCVFLAFGDLNTRLGASLARTTSATQPLSLRQFQPRGYLSPRPRVSLRRCVSQEDENREAYKEVIKEYVKDGIGSESVAAWRNDINEMLFRLEPLNPTTEPAYSKLLEGDWEFKFLGSMAKGILPSPTREIALLLYAGGYTPGRFGIDIAARLPKSVVDVKDIKLSIGNQAPTGSITTKIALAGTREVDVKLATNLEPESDFTMSETYQTLSIMGRDVQLPQQLQSKRKFYIRYLDEDLLVVRDDTGVADVLMKVKEEPTPAPTPAPITVTEPPTAATVIEPEISESS